MPPRDPAAVAAVLLAWSCPVLAQEPTPPSSPPLRTEVLDGLRLRDVETGAIYRLYGISTCAPGQRAWIGRQPWPCGTMAAAWLVTATLTHWIACRVIRDEAGEQLARCASAEHPDLAADMLRQGLAVRTPVTVRDPAIQAYAAAERDARQGRRGLWSGTMPVLAPDRTAAGVAAGRSSEPIP